VWNDLSGPPSTSRPPPLKLWGTPYAFALLAGTQLRQQTFSCRRKSFFGLLPNLFAQTLSFPNP